MPTKPTRSAALLLALFALACHACTLADVTVPASEDRLVVEAVLRTDVAEQTLILHRSVQGAVAPGEPGAAVTVTRGDGLEVTFRESPQACFQADSVYLRNDSLDIQANCYRSDAGHGYWVRPGDTYELRVETQRGEVARARTHVPGGFGLVGVPFRARMDQPPARCTLPPATQLPLVWTRSAGAWGYLAPMRASGLSLVLPDTIEVPEPLELVGLAISSSDTTLVLPREFGVFDRFDLDQNLLRALQNGFPPRVLVSLTIAAADRNYINGVRGGSFNPSGQVRVSSIVGDGVGVFGSLVPLSMVVEVQSEPSSVPGCLTGR